MDRIVHYSIRDILSVDDNLSIDLRITTIGFPVDETLEYQSSGKWFEDISTISRTYIGTDKEEHREHFQSRLLSFLDDGNMRVIMDIMGQLDEYSSERYKLGVVVNSVEIID